MARPLNFNSELGFVLPFVLGISMLILAITALSANYSERFLRIIAFSKHAGLAREENLNKLLGEMRLEQSTPGMFCQSKESKRGATTLNSSLCLETHSTNLLQNGFSMIEAKARGENSLMPAFDFNLVFRDFAACEATPLLTRQLISNSGIAFSDTGSQSDLLCSWPSKILPAKLVLNANLTINEDVKLTAQHLGASIIAATGYIEITSLSLESDTLIISGGDILIDSLKTKSGIKATLISTTGAINISEVSGGGLIQILAWSGSDVVTSSSALVPTLLPPFLPISVLGIEDSSG